MIIPVGSTLRGQELVRIRRSGDGEELTREDLGAVRFVPLVGERGWTEEGQAPSGSGEAPGRTTDGSGPSLPDRIGRSAEPFDDIETADLDPLLERIGDARLVLLGEASHGTSDFYRMRARITRELIEKRGFDFVAVEADWPDAAEIDAFVRHRAEDRPHMKPFQRFPRWMWANTDVLDFARWLRRYNEQFGDQAPGRMAGFHGLDLYSMHTSIDAVLDYLDDVDPDAAEVARDRYGCLMPWQNDPALYGQAVLSGRFQECEEEAVGMLRDLLEKRMDYAAVDGERFVDAIQNARLVANAERYYRSIYQGQVSSWNLRDQHMFDTLQMLLGVYGQDSRGVVWAHNSHLGDASATAMGDRGEHNVGQLTREAFGPEAFLVGFGTHTGTVAAASNWGEPMQVMDVRPSRPGSYEHLAHRADPARFLLHLRDPSDRDMARALAERRLERAIGVLYRPDTELQSHYFKASLPRQFDEWIWMEETGAVTPIGEADVEGELETYPFGL